jgi:site-specific DNA-methyltransferase (adenine-specific)
MNADQLTEGVTLYAGDCLDVLKTLAPDSVDSCVCDPPYHLTSIVKRFANAKGETEYYALNKSKSAYMSRGFMGKVWDGGEIAFEPETWAAVLRVLKPGGHLCAFGAPRNFGFMQCAITNGGFEVRDVIAWLFGSGFPKSHNLDGGLGTALKPGYEPIILARKPLSEKTIALNVARWGTGALNIDGCRVGTEPVEIHGYNGNSFSQSYKDQGTSPELAKYKTVNGRWPANVIHDGSDEVVGAFPETHSAGAQRDEPGGGTYQGSGTDCDFGAMGVGRKGFRVGDAGGSAARFFYTAKADADDRLGSKHPTVKPLNATQ